MAQDPNNISPAVSSWVIIRKDRLKANVQAIGQRLNHPPPEIPIEVSSRVHGSSRLCQKTPDSRDGSVIPADDRRDVCPTSSFSTERSTLLCGVIKANGYGLGLAEYATCLAEQEQIHMLGVFSSQQASQIASLKKLPSKPILIMGPLFEIHKDEVLLQAAKEADLHLSVHSLADLEPMNCLGQAANKTLAVHVHLDTAMSRGGLLPHQLGQAIQRISHLPCLKLVGLSTHFASADIDPSLTQTQLTQFLEITQQVKQSPASTQAPPLLRHAANSYGIWASAANHLGMARVGLSLLGFGSLPQAQEQVQQQASLLKPIMQWVSRIVHVQTYQAGTKVGYHQTHTLKRQSILGVVPVGYGDGYPITLSHKAVVTIAGQACPVVGMVNMDQIVVDLTQLTQPIDVGQQVILISDNLNWPNSCPYLAKCAQSSIYEMHCRIAQHVPRIWVD